MNIGQSALLTDIAMCLNYYRLFSPGLYCCVLAPVQLDSENQIRPGVMLMVNYGKHKTSDPDADYEVFQGPPNLVADVFSGNDQEAYLRRRSLMESSGVEEYLALMDGSELTWKWNRLVEKNYQSLEPEQDHVIRSVAMPGLWFPYDAFRQRDWWQIMAAIARGVTRRGHHELMDSIWNADE